MCFSLPVISRHAAKRAIWEKMRWGGIKMSSLVLRVLPLLFLLGVPRASAPERACRRPSPEKKHQALCVHPERYVLTYGTVSPPRNPLAWYTHRESNERSRAAVANPPALSDATTALQQCRTRFELRIQSAAAPRFVSRTLTWTGIEVCAAE